MRCKGLYLLAFALAQGCATMSPEPAVSPTGTASGGHSQRAEAMLQALSAIGVGYRNAGNSHAHGFDCSGLVAHVQDRQLCVERCIEQRHDMVAGKGEQLARARTRQRARDELRSAHGHRYCRMPSAPTSLS